MGDLSNDTALRGFLPEGEIDIVVGTPLTEQPFDLVSHAGREIKPRMHAFARAVFIETGATTVGNVSRSRPSRGGSLLHHPARCCHSFRQAERRQRLIAAVLLWRPTDGARRDRPFAVFEVDVFRFPESSAAAS
ncbi:hypothetical protein BH11PSE8_BH11PSE8_21320 [soil metagenome]